MFCSLSNKRQTERTGLPGQARRPQLCCIWARGPPGQEQVCEQKLVPVHGEGQGPEH